MEIQQLKGFIAVANQRSFSKAAEKTFRTQPAITLQIKTLENEFGTKLFNRQGGQKVLLTEEGQILYDLASPLINEVESLKKRFNEERGNIQKGSIRIATHTSVMQYLLPDKIRKFKTKFPECEISILNKGRSEILSLLKEGAIDIGICSLKSIPNNIDYRAFAKFKKILITPKKHTLAKKKNVSLKDIAEYPLIIPPIGTNTRDIVENALMSKGLEYKIVMEVVGRDAVKTYVRLGMGISIINEYYTTPDDRKNLFILDVSKYFGETERGILTRKNSYLSYHAKEFINILTPVNKF